jgi:hypothetical protein
MFFAEIIQQKLRNLITLLIEGEYDLILERCENGRLTKEEIISAINDYGSGSYIIT